MAIFLRAGCAALLSILATALEGQELQPRAYVPTPQGLNFFGVSYSYSAGGLLFDPSLPITDSNVDANIVTFAFGQTLGVLGRTAQVLAILPYAQANLDGIVSGVPLHRYRSGLADTTFRYAMNIYGAPAMSLEEFARYRQKTIVGASLTVTAPTGQYDPAVLANVGTNRWGFKPELGVSRAFQKWTLEGAAGVWLYTSNDQFAGSSVRSQAPLGSLQAHLVRLLPHRSWIAADGTYFTGGRTQVGDRESADYRSNLRIGATLAIGLTPRQVIKISYFDGAISRVGSDISSIGVSYNVVWKKGRLRGK
jgi:hypothetical protein